MGGSSVREWTSDRRIAMLTWSAEGSVTITEAAAVTELVKNVQGTA